MAAYVLTKAGAHVVMLEAGPSWFASRDSKMMVPNWATPHRGASIHGRPFGEFDACVGGWEIDGEPYTKAPGTQFSWWRARMLGGRTNHWGRISLRFGPDDFRGKSIDGLGDDWPISYDDVKPYYDNVDRFIGTVRHRTKGCATTRTASSTPPPKPRCYELLVKKASDKLNITCIPARLSIITKPLQRPAGVPLLRPVQSRLSGERELLEPRRADRAGAADGQADAAHERDGARGHGRRRRAGDRRRRTSTRTPVPTSTCARRSSCSRRARWRSARLLLNSKSSQFPHGLANSSGVGRQVSDRHDRRRRVGTHSGDGWTTSRTTTTASAACTSTCRGGSTTRSSTSRAAITSRCAAAPGSRAPASAAASSARTAAATASSSRTTTAGTTARRSASPAAAR